MSGVVIQVTQDAGRTPEGLSCGGDPQKATEESWLLLLTLRPSQGGDGHPWDFLLLSSCPTLPGCSNDRDGQLGSSGEAPSGQDLDSRAEAALSLPFAP